MKPTKKVQTTENRIPGILESMSSGMQLGKSEIRILLRAGYEVPDTQEKKNTSIGITLKKFNNKKEALQNELKIRKKVPKSEVFDKSNMF